MKVREASFAMRVVRRRSGLAAILYRRRLMPSGQERLDRIAAISPLAFSSGMGLLRSAARDGGDSRKFQLQEGPFYPIDADWGPRLACFALCAQGLRNANRLSKCADHLYHSDPTEAAWWFGTMTGNTTGKANRRVVRALRILTEAVS